MGSDLRPLGDYVTLASGNTPSKSNPAYWNGTTPWVSAKDMREFWIEDSEDHLTDAGVSAASRVVPAGTVLMLTRGMTLHNRVPICQAAKESAFNQDVKAVLPKDGILPRFIPYLLTGNHDRLHERVDAAGHGTGRLNTQAILSLPVRVPSEGQQLAISEVGEAIDGQILLLRQINITLEAIAQALFKSWFVDFGPVRAKAEGRELKGMGAATVALFPASFEGSGLGKIPKGWRVASLQEHITAERGLSYKGAGLAEDGVPMHNLNSVLEGGGYKYSGIKYYRGDYKDRHIARPGDIIVANTEQGHHHRLIGFPAIVPHDFKTGIYSHHLYRVRIDELSGLTQEWLYHCLMAPAVRDQIIGCANGSTVNMLKPAGLQIPKFAVPPAELCKAFDAIAAPIREASEANVARMRSLSALRDTLLPRLIYGKLRLPDVEREIEAAAA